MGDRRKRFADGKVSFAYKRFLGYDKDSDGNIVINEGQAQTVKLIYKLFLDGLTMHSIANELTKRGLKPLLVRINGVNQPSEVF